MEQRKRGPPAGNLPWPPFVLPPWARRSRCFAGLDVIASLGDSRDFAPLTAYLDSIGPVRAFVLAARSSWLRVRPGCAFVLAARSPYDASTAAGS
jgi:hypothetical protein